MSPQRRGDRKWALGMDDNQPGPMIKPSDTLYRGILIRAGVYPHDYRYPDVDPDPPNNLDNILERLARRRASLSPSQFTDTDFRQFQQDVARADSEDQSWSRVMATIEGRHNYYSMSKYYFNHVDKFAKEIADAVPDSWDGAIPEKVHPKVLHDLDITIVPCNETSRPAVPNFFLEAKSASGSGKVAMLQACHTGAIGARGVNALQNYGQEIWTYDGNAYTFTNTYYHDGGLLQLYVTHPTAPKIAGGRPEYHMTRLSSFAMINDSETFRKGATAYRNARDLVSENRDAFIQQANAIARSVPD